MFFFFVRICIVIVIIFSYGIDHGDLPCIIRYWHQNLIEVKLLQNKSFFSSIQTNLAWVVCSSWPLLIHEGCAGVWLWRVPYSFLSKFLSGSSPQREHRATRDSSLSTGMPGCTGIRDGWSSKGAEDLALRCRPMELECLSGQAHLLIGREHSIWPGTIADSGCPSLGCQVETAATAALHV